MFLFDYFEGRINEMSLHNAPNQNITAILNGVFAQNGGILTPEMFCS